MPYSDGDIGPRRLRIDSLSANVYLDDLLDVTITEHNLELAGAPSPSLVGDPITSYSATAAATQAVALIPSPAIYNTILLLVAGTDGFDDPADWSKQFGGIFLSSGSGYALYKHRVTGKESWYASASPTVTITFDTAARFAAIAQEINGNYDWTDGDIGVDETGTSDPAFATGTSNAPDPVSGTAQAGEAFLWMPCLSVDSGVTVSSYPSGYTLGQASVASGSGAGHVTVAVAAKQTAVAVEHPGNYSISASADWKLWTEGWVGALPIILDNEVLAYDTVSEEWINQTPRHASILGLSTDDKAFFKTADTDTYLKYAANSLRFVIGGSTVLVMSSTGCVMTT